MGSQKDNTQQSLLISLVWYEKWVPQTDFLKFIVFIVLSFDALIYKITPCNHPTPKIPCSHTVLVLACNYN